MIESRRDVKKEKNIYTRSLALLHAFRTCMRLSFFGCSLLTFYSSLFEILSVCLIILCGKKKKKIKYSENREQGKPKIKKKKVNFDKVQNKNFENMSD